MIPELNTEIEKIKALIEDKKTELFALLKQRKEQESLLHPMSKFVDKTYIYDRPQKWNSPRIGVFSEQEIETFKYLIFNGVVLGETLNKLYDKQVFMPKAKYATFVIPDDGSFLNFDEEKTESEDYVEINNIYELLALKI